MRNMEAKTSTRSLGGSSSSSSFDGDDRRSTGGAWAIAILAGVSWLMVTFAHPASAPPVYRQRTLQSPAPAAKDPAVQRGHTRREAREPVEVQSACVAPREEGSPSDDGASPDDELASCTSG